MLGVQLLLSFNLVLLLSMKQSEAMSGEMAEVLIKHQKEFLSNATECKMKVGATDEDVLIFMSRKKLPDTKTGDCFIACMMEKMDLIQNGKYLEDATQMIAHKILGPGDMVAELIGDVSKACAKTITADDDSCKAAKKIAECSMLHVKKFKEVTKKM